MKNSLKVCITIIFLTAIFVIPTLKVKAYDMSSWIDISEFTLPSWVNLDNDYAIIFQSPYSSGYRLVLFSKASSIGASTSTNQDFPYLENITFANYNNGVSAYLDYWDTPSLDSKIFNPYSSGDSYNFGAIKIIYSSVNIYHNIPGTIKADLTNPWLDLSLIDDEPTPSNPFTITYEQGEVLMASSQSSANLVTMNLTSTNFSPVDYIFTYSYSINDVELPSNFTFMPTCSTLVDSNEDIQYSCFYNIPMYYNTDIHFSIIEKENLDEIYSYDLSAYLDILPSDSYYSIYQVNGYKYINISDIDSGHFALSKELAYVESGIGTLQSNVDIYVVDYVNNTKQDFETSSYFVSKSIDNGLAVFDFDFNGNSNLYLLFDVRLSDMFIGKQSVYLYAPSSSYVHLSDLVTCDSDEVDYESCVALLDEPSNKQAYKDSNGVINYVSSNLVYDDTSGTKFSNIFGKSLLTFSSVFSTIGILYTSFVSELPSSILFAIYLSFGLLITCIVIKIWL